MSKRTDGLLGWHFLPDDGLTQFAPRIKVEVGQTLTEARPLQMCRVGLHAGERALDALQYAPGSLVCCVRLEGQILRKEDKWCASERTVLAMGDATRLLHEFACWCAEVALLRERAAGREPAAAAWAAIAAKRQWLAGEIDAAGLDAARATARAAASAASGLASWATSAAASAAARGDAWNDAWLAAWDAASAAWAATRSAASSAARDAAAIEQNAELERRLLVLLGEGTNHSNQASSR